jgi:hypothetical protein
LELRNNAAAKVAAAGAGCNPAEVALLFNEPFVRKPADGERLLKNTHTHIHTHCDEWQWRTCALYDDSWARVVSLQPLTRMHTPAASSSLSRLRHCRRYCRQAPRVAAAAAAAAAVGQWPLLPASPLPPALSASAVAQATRACGRRARSS